MFDLAAIQDALRAESLDGWLLYDFRGSNPLALRVLGLGGENLLTRRLFCYIPAQGEPQKLVHRIEDSVLAHLPGTTRLYSSREELLAALAEILAGPKRVAMEYAPAGTNPYISRVDTGTIELVRSLGPEVVPSGDLVQRFDAVWSDEQWGMHRDASEKVLAAFDLVWDHLRQRIAAGESPRESDVQRLMADRLEADGLVTDHPPIIATGPHCGNPHYAPVPGSDSAIGPDALVLVDAWGKPDHPDGVYADYTRMAFTGPVVPDVYRDLFGIVARARDAAIGLIQDAFAAGRTLQGWQVDQAARDVIDAAGYAEAFTHRTGHSIARELHGSGAHMDNFETRDERTVLPGTCFSIEPGIYLPDCGIRSEVNVYIDPTGGVHVTGDPQTEILALG